MSNRLSIKDAPAQHEPVQQPTVFAASPHGHALAAVVIVLPVIVSPRLPRQLRLVADDRRHAATERAASRVMSGDRAA